MNAYLIILFFGILLSATFLFFWGKRYIAPKLDKKTNFPPQYPESIEHANTIPISGKLEFSLAVGAFVIYLIVRLSGLNIFPIYFFTDEAAQTVFAEELVENNFVIDDEFLPTFLYNTDKFSLGTSVYLQVLPYILFGKSVFLTRGTSVLVSSLAAIAIGLVLKQFFKTRIWWIGILLLSVTPAWFLHSRTAFETAIATAFYALFLHAYLLYLYRSPRYIYWAVFTAALVFYTYNPARAVVIISSILFLVSDFRIHWQNKKYLRNSAVLLFVLALPYFRFKFLHLHAERDQLLLLNSYWLTDISFSKKVLFFLQEYFKGFSISYWFFPHTQDIIRHVMKGYGHFLLPSLPFFFIGLWNAIKNYRVPAYRVFIIALLSAPVGGALVESFVTRSLIIVVPIILLTAIGLIKTINWSFFSNAHYSKIIISLFALFSFLNAFMLYDSLSNGPIWFDDYGLYGMQYGGQQVFSYANQYLNENQEGNIYVSGKWLNAPSKVMRFFVTQPQRIKWIPRETDQVNLSLESRDILIVTTQEKKYLIENQLASEKIRELDMISYPDGSSGFYILQIISNEE